MQQKNDKKKWLDLGFIVFVIIILLFVLFVLRNIDQQSELQLKIDSMKNSLNQQSLKLDRVLRVLDQKHGDQV